MWTESSWKGMNDWAVMQRHLGQFCRKNHPRGEKKTMQSTKRYKEQVMKTHHGKSIMWKYPLRREVSLQILDKKSKMLNAQ